MMMVSLKSEPLIEFGLGQAVEDPRDGLTLFGPFDSAGQDGLSWGLIGTDRTVAHFAEWVRGNQRPIINQFTGVSRPFFPGFEAAFRTRWPERPRVRRILDSDALDRAVRVDDRQQRVFGVVDLVANAIREAVRTADESVAVWFVVIPDSVYQYCRPNSTVPKALQVAATSSRPSRAQLRARLNLPLFPDDERNLAPYDYDPHFRHQLKARLLDTGAIVQIVRESTIAFQQVTKRNGKPLRDLAKVQSDIAWTLSTAAFYKSGKRPWRLASARPGVCYMGFAFKQDPRARDARTACCAAQMFLDSGDGFVFRSHIGPWFNPNRGDYHLKTIDADEMLSEAIAAYTGIHGRPPEEVFVHSKNHFDHDEWKGFRAAAGAKSRVVAVRIREDRGLKFFSTSAHPILRGTAFLQGPRTAYLWSRGFAPRLNTYDGREVPAPLRVDIERGDADIDQVLGDVLALTKLNYNSCRFADGIPVTLRFADAVGEILTAGPLQAVPPLPFKFYI
jgi:hypothetical protein